MDIDALILNCTLKKSPEPSNTQGLIDIVTGHFDELGVAHETLRPVDFNIPFGVVSDMGEGDEWPQILEKVLAVDILIIGMSIWFGVRNSVSQMVIERLDGSSSGTRFRRRATRSPAGNPMNVAVTTTACPAAMSADVQSWLASQICRAARG
jgi:multimeric flavodoxin WrbA